MIHVWKHTWWKVNLTRYQYLSYHQSLPDGSCELKLHGFLERTAFSKIVMFSTSQAPLTDRQTLNFKLTRYLFALQRFSTVKLQKEGTNIQNIKVKKKPKQHTCTLYDYYIKYFIRYNILTPFLLLLEARHSLSFLEKKVKLIFYFMYQTHSLIKYIFYWSVLKFP